jgi:ribose/xylose/arabinose/galactoside ABC-type transport system permease subunit
VIRERFSPRRFLARRMMETVLVVLCTVLAFRAPNFASAENLLTVLRSISMQGLIAFGMTLVIVVGEIDLSVGAAAAFAGCLLAWLAKHHVSIALGLPAVVATGGAIGLFTGVMRARFAVPSFITTLALMTGLRGLALMITGGFPLTSFPAWYYSLAWGDLVGVPFPTVALIAGFVAIHILASRTSFGRAVYATGSNPIAARLSGIPVARVRTLCLASTGALAALSGAMLAAQIMAGTPTVAQGWELDVIAAVIIGGTTLTGGAGTVWGTLVGIVLIGVIGNGMTLLDVPVYDQYVVRGMLIFAAVLLNRVQVQT